MKRIWFLGGFFARMPINGLYSVQPERSKKMRIRSILILFLSTGCSIPVVRTIRVRVDWVRFPAARVNEMSAGSFLEKRNAVEYTSQNGP